MSWNLWNSRGSVAITTIVVTLIALSIESASAHSGHTHTGDGFDVTAVLQVAGTAAALGITYLMASRLYHHREEVHGSAESGQDDSAA